MKINSLFKLLLFCNAFFCLESVIAQDNLSKEKPSFSEKRVTPIEDVIVKNQDYFLLLGMPKVTEKIKHSISEILEKTKGATLINWCETDKVFVLECKPTNKDEVYKDISKKMITEGYNFPILIKEAKFNNIKELDCL